MIDGVIKYTINHTKCEAPEFRGYKDLEALRSRLFALGLIGELDGIGYGNISSKEQAGSFFITATQTGAVPNLQKEHYTYIKEYDFSSFSLNSFGAHKPSSEALSHAMIYEIDSAIEAVIHIHSKALWEFMQSQNALFTTAEYGTIEMVNEIASLYEGKNPFDDAIFVMKGHEDGIIAFGKSIQEAEQKIHNLLAKYDNLPYF